MPVDFTKYRFVDVIGQMVDQINQSAEISFQFTCLGEIRRLSPERELILYRICKELISNVLKHSKATEAYVQLLFQEEILILFVEDNGTGGGEIIGESQNERIGIGLKNVSSRAVYIGAKLMIDNHTRGMTIILQVPYESKQFSKSKNSDN